MRTFKNESKNIDLTISGSGLYSGPWPRCKECNSPMIVRAGKGPHYRRGDCPKCKTMKWLKKPEHLKAKMIFKSVPWLSEYKFHKGKHAGKTWNEVYAADKSYLLWMQSNESFSADFRRQITIFLESKGDLLRAPPVPGILNQSHLSSALWSTTHCLWPSAPPKDLEYYERFGEDPIHPGELA